MPNATELLADYKVQALVFGYYKMGKTEGAATFPRPNFLLFDPHGLDTVMSPGYKLRHPEVKLEEILWEYFHESQYNAQGIVTNHEAFDQACAYFDRCMKGGKWKSPTTGKEYSVHPDMFDTWVVDSATTLITVATNKAVQLLGDPSFAGKALSNTFKAALAKGMLVPKLQDFGAERSLTEQFIRMVLDSGKHVIVLCHERQETNEAGQVTDIVPLLTGQSVQRVSLMFSNVCRLTSKKEGPNTKRYLELVGSGAPKVGSRLEIPDGTEWNWPAVKQALRLTEG